jgi:hypothetical protein
MSIPSTSGLIGFTNDQYDTTPKFTQGVVVVAGDNAYTYALASAAVAAAGQVALTGSYGSTATTSGTTYTHDVGGSGVPAGAYAWFKLVTSPF